jgi:ABC-type amino acid transport substrate-binding protein
MLLQRNLDPIVYFTNYDGVDNVARQIVADVATGKIDVALVWGPVAGYFARRQAVPLQTKTFEASADAPARLAFPISFGVRDGDKNRAGAHREADARTVFRNPRDPQRQRRAPRR